MTIINSYTIADGHTQAITGSRYVVHHFVDDITGDFALPPMLVPGTDTETEHALFRALYISRYDYKRAIQEVNEALLFAESGNNPDRVPQYQTQAEFDRRVLGRAMLLRDVHTLYAIYPMFVAVRTRGGANAAQRAAYLGITSTQWNLIDTRFNDLNGSAVFISDEKNQRWLELPTEFN